jgi:hypothetical protein
VHNPKTDFFPAVAVTFRRVRLSGLAVAATAGRGRTSAPPGRIKIQATLLTSRQLRKEAHKPRSSRKRSIGAELDSARIRHSPTPVH